MRIPRPGKPHIARADGGWCVRYMWHKGQKADTEAVRKCEAFIRGVLRRGR